MILSVSNIILEVVPRAIQQVLDQRGALQRIVLMRAHAMQSKDLVLDSRQDHRALFETEKSCPTRSYLADIGQPPERHPA